MLATSLCAASLRALCLRIHVRALVVALVSARELRAMEAKVVALEAQVAALAAEVAALKTWRADVEERRRQARARAAEEAAAAASASVGKAETDGVEASVSVGADAERARRAEQQQRGSSGGGGAVAAKRPPATLARLVTTVWRRAQGYLLRGAINFLVFLYMSKLHRWILSVGYKYYVLLLLRLG